MTIARSPPNGITTVVGVLGAGRVPIQLDALVGQRASHEISGHVLSERRRDGGRQPEPRSRRPR